MSDELRDYLRKTIKEREAELIFWQIVETAPSEVPKALALFIESGRFDLYNRIGEIIVKRYEEAQEACYLKRIEGICKIKNNEEA